MSFRRILSTITILVTALLALAAGTIPAQAARYAGGGTAGYYIAPQSVCRHLTNGTLTMTIPPPTIYAANYRAGGGNDSDYVRYRAFLVDYNTGRTLDSTGYSGWAYATDNGYGNFSGSGVFIASERGRYYVDYRIEWYYGGAWVAHRVDRMPYYNKNRVGPMGNFNNCMAF